MASTKTINTTEKGDLLEDSFYEYLSQQKNDGALVFGIYSPQTCQIHRKKKFYCTERQDDVEFDVVLEIRRSREAEPHTRIIFECKNHKSPIQERDIRDFSDKVSGIFRHGAKAVLVSSSRLQSGAQNVAESRKIGLVKYNSSGFEVIAERQSKPWTGHRFLENQLFEVSTEPKPLRFAAFWEGGFYSSPAELIAHIETDFRHTSQAAHRSPETVPYLSDADIELKAKQILDTVQHYLGAVDLEKVCKALDLKLRYKEHDPNDQLESEVLGYARFDNRSIQINHHNNFGRERFTIGHEIGHFSLGHEKFLKSDIVVKADLLAQTAEEESPEFNLQRLEVQANKFASELLMPRKQFLLSVEALRQELEIVDRGHGPIFVDDQECNRSDFHALCTRVGAYFEVSKSAVEVRLKRLGLVNDQRSRNFGTWQIGNSFVAQSR